MIIHLIIKLLLSKIIKMAERKELTIEEMNMIETIQLINQKNLS